MTLSAGVLLKAGANYSNLLNSGTQGKTGKVIVDEFIEQAEAYINAITRYDWVTNWASIGTNYQKILTQLCEDLAAMECIKFDMDTYGLNTAQTMLDVLKDRTDRAIEILRLNEIQEKLV